MNTVLLYLSLAGVLFSGYLSGVKFFSSQCAFGETCPLFLGYPACYFGFTLFVILMISASLLVFTRLSRRVLLQAMTFVSLLGVLFAGSYTLDELPLLLSEGVQAYILGLPTCALGFLFFACLLFLCTRGLIREYRMGATA